MGRGGGGCIRVWVWVGVHMWGVGVLRKQFPWPRVVGDGVVCGVCAHLCVCVVETVIWGGGGWGCDVGTSVCALCVHAHA